MVDYSIDYVSPLQAGMEGFESGQRMMLMRQKQEQIQAAAQRQNEMKTALAQFSAKPRTAAEYRKLNDLFPELGEQVKQSMSILNEEQKQAKINQLLPIYAALESDNPKVAIRKLDESIAAAKNSGQDNDAALMEQVKEQIEMGPQGIKGAKTSAGIFLANVMGEDFFKLQKSLGGEQSAPEFQSVGGGIIVRDPVTNTEKLVTGKWNKATGQLEVSGAELPGQLVSRLGETPGETTARTVSETRQKKEQEAAVSKSAEYAERLDKINEGIAVLDEAKSVIDQGIERGENLGVGPIRQYLPKLNKAAVDLKSVASRLGLSVISSVQFGALSEGELKLAMQTGLPTALTGKDLSDWINKRKAAQQKLADYLEEASIFLGEEGNTIAKWREYQRDKRKQNEQGAAAPPPTATGAPSAPAAAAPTTPERTATNPKTGQKIAFRNGQWVDIQTGKPLQ